MPTVDTSKWDRTAFCSLGVIETDGVKSRCHVCGKWFGHLGAHVVRIHGISCNDYRKLYELKSTDSLIGPALKKNRAETLAPRIDEFHSKGQDALALCWKDREWLKKHGGRATSLGNGKRKPWWTYNHRVLGE